MTTLIALKTASALQHEMLAEVQAGSFTSIFGMFGRCLLSPHGVPMQSPRRRGD